MSKESLGSQFEGDSSVYNISREAGENDTLIRTSRGQKEGLAKGRLGNYLGQLKGSLNAQEKRSKAAKAAKMIRAR